MKCPLGLYLQSSPPRDIIARMLRNLKEIHRSQQDWPRLIASRPRMLLEWATSESADASPAMSPLS